MHSLLSLTIDASVLDIPHTGCTKNDVVQYVNTLRGWGKLLNETWVDIYISERTCNFLYPEGSYSLIEQLKELFTAHGIEEFDPYTFARIVDQLLRHTPSFEEHYQVVDVLYEHLKTDPDIVLLTTRRGLRDNLDRCITLIAILREHCSQPLGGHLFILRKVPKQVIQVRADIHEIEHSRDDIPALLCPPEFFEGDVLVCEGFRGLIDCLDESEILVDAFDDLEIKLAIRIALFKDAINRNEFPDWDCEIPIIGSEFRKSCQKICTDRGGSLPRKILRSIVRTIEGYNLRDVHALRTGSGGNDPQKTRKRDKAKAWRRDIDDDLHLHYWRCTDGTIELASVLPHNNDFSIPE